MAAEGRVLSDHDAEKELARLTQPLSEAEETVRAIYHGAVDAVVVQAQPGEVFEDARDEFGAAAGGVDVLDAEKDGRGALPGGKPGHEEGAGVAGVKAARGGGRHAARREGHGAGFSATGSSPVFASCRMARMAGLPSWND